MRVKKPTAKEVLFENVINPEKMVNRRRQYFTPLNNAYKYDGIFPLTQIKYDGMKVSAPNDINAVLGQKFGDIHNLPPVIGFAFAIIAIWATNGNYPKWI